MSLVTLSIITAVAWVASIAAAFVTSSIMTDIHEKNLDPSLPTEAETASTSVMDFYVLFYIIIPLLATVKLFFAINNARQFQYENSGYDY